MTSSFESDVQTLKSALASLPVVWEGKETILKLKEADYNWRQMEWWAFYFEHLCKSRLAGVFQIPGEAFGTTRFDLQRSVNWDYKAKAIKSDDHKAILNDKAATDASVTKYGEHGIIIALCDVEYNDVDRSFQKWHTELKGGHSPYEKKRMGRTSVSRYRKTSATLTEILFLRLTSDDLPALGTYKQGRNSNDKPRPQKYMLDLEDSDDLIVDRIPFAQTP